MGLPLASLITSVTIGLSPATKNLPFAGADIVRTMSSCSTLTEGSWATAIGFTPPVSAGWHSAQLASLAWGPPSCFLNCTGVLSASPNQVASWQVLQASRDGSVFQRLS